MNNKIKEILDKCTPFLFGDEVDKLTDYITNLQQKVEQYENPDDLTLFYMWLDTKAKDKMKQLENKVMMLRQQNTMITTLGEDYKSRCEKAREELTYMSTDAYTDDYDIREKHYNLFMNILKGSNNND